VLSSFRGRNANASSPASWRKRVLRAAVWLLMLAPIKVLAGLVEYSIILALIAIIVIAIEALPPGSKTVVQQLQTSVTAAQSANDSGNQKQELSNLGKAIGTTQALMGMTGYCGDSDACGDVRNTLQEIIGLTSKLRARLVKSPNGCNPDGVIARNEQCDPLASPTGCPTSPFPSFCDDACLCEVIQTTTTTTSTTTSTVGCSAGETNCGGTCVDLTNDPDNCGSCGHVCPVATPSCVASVCTIL
jgi:Flp pilus assembly pilin Flp